MRDADRIPEVLEALRKAWEANPDLRLGQLIAGAAEKHTATPGSAFYVEDDAMLKGLQDMTPQPKPEHVHSFWNSKWYEEGILQVCKDSDCGESRMVYYR